MSRFARQSKVQTQPRGTARQAMIVVAMGVALVLGVVAIGQTVTAMRRPTETAAARTLGDDEIYTGSILYMPAEGLTCHQLLFDNQTGQFSDNGLVDCERAAYQGVNGTTKHWSAARVQVISTGFRQH